MCRPPLRSFRACLQSLEVVMGNPLGSPVEPGSCRWEGFVPSIRNHHGAVPRATVWPVAGCTGTDTTSRAALFGARVPLAGRASGGACGSPPPPFSRAVVAAGSMGNWVVARAVGLARYVKPPSWDLPLGGNPSGSVRLGERDRGRGPLPKASVRFVASAA